MKPTQARAPRDAVVEIRRPPRWRTSDPAMRFSVECCKSSGLWVVFSRYATRAEAHQVAARLQAVGASVRVVAGSDAE